MNLDSQTKKFLEDLEAAAPRPWREPSVDEARRNESARQAESAVPVLPADIDDRVIETGPTGRVNVRLFRPMGAAAPLRAAMYFHGGGWVVGGPDTHDRLLRELATLANTAVVFVDYARAPESRYPVALEQAYAATRWISEHGAEWDLDSSRPAVVGDSSGGNLAAAVTLLAKARAGPPIDRQVLFFPATDAGMDSPSHREFAEGPFLTRELMDWFWDQYAPDRAARREVTASPLLASLEQLTGLPPALVITAEYDSLRDEGEAYAHRLMQAGVPVTATRYLGAIHAFVVLNAFARTPSARAAVAQAARFLAERAP